MAFLSHTLAHLLFAPLRAVGPSLAVLALLRLLAGRSVVPKGRHHSPPRPFLARAARALFRQWATVELLWWLYFLFERWRLQARRLPTPPVRTALARAALLERVLDSSEMVVRGAGPAADAETANRGAGAVVEVGPGAGRADPFPSRRDAERTEGKDGGTNMCIGAERIMRRCGDRRRKRGGLGGGHEGGGSGGGSGSGSGSGNGTSTTAMSAMAVAALDADDDAAGWSTAADAAWVLEQRRSEVQGFFCGAPFEDVRRGNVREYLAWAFWSALPSEVPPGEQQAELDGMVARCESFVGLEQAGAAGAAGAAGNGNGDGSVGSAGGAGGIGGERATSGGFPTGIDPDVHAMRLTLDPVQASYRPLALYGATMLGVDALLYAGMWSMGFTRHAIGTVHYWRRPGGGDAVAPPPSGSSHRHPLVFIHGLGVGILPYMYFLRQLIVACPEQDLFAVELPYVSRARTAKRTDERRLIK